MSIPSSHLWVWDTEVEQLLNAAAIDRFKISPHDPEVDSSHLTLSADETEAREANPVPAEPYALWAVSGTSWRVIARGERRDLLRAVSTLTENFVTMQAPARFVYAPGSQRFVVASALGVPISDD